MFMVKNKQLLATVATDFYSQQQWTTFEFSIYGWLGENASTIIGKGRTKMWNQM